MLYAGLDLSRKRLDVHVLRDDGTTALVTAVAPDASALRTLVRRVAAEGGPVRATIESMNGARFVHDSLEFAGWDVLIADAQRVRGLAPLAAKTDKIDARVLAELTRRALVPEIWLPTPEVRAERERARFRLHLVRHRTALKNRISATLMTFGHPCPMADLFGVAGRKLLDSLALPEPWQASLSESLALVDDLTARVDALEVELRQLGADHPSMRLLMTVVLGLLRGRAAKLARRGDDRGCWVLRADAEAARDRGGTRGSEVETCRYPRRGEAGQAEPVHA